MKLSTTTRMAWPSSPCTEPRIDAAVAIQFKDAMRAATDGGPDRVILDLSGVDFIDSSGLGAIVAAMKHLGATAQTGSGRADARCGQGVSPDADGFGL